MADVSALDNFSRSTARRRIANVDTTSSPGDKERATLLCNGNVIGPEDLPGEKFTTPVLERDRPSAAQIVAPGSGTPEFEAERQRIMGALESNGGNQTLAAKQLGISRRTMLNRLDAYAIPRPRKGKG